MHRFAPLPACLVAAFALLLTASCTSNKSTGPKPQRVAQPDPAAKGSTDPRLQELYACWLEKPYEYMFQKPSEDAEVVFMGGINGILYYGNLAECMGKLVGTAQRGYADPTPIAAFAGLAILAADHREGAPFRSVNPAIVRWGHQHLIPDPGMTMNGKTAQAHYDDTFSRFFRLMSASYAWLKEEPQRWKSAWAKYEQAQTKGLDGLDWLDTTFQGALPDFMESPDGTTMTAPMAIGFWLRRGADGTADELWVGLRKLLSLYDGEWLESLNVQP